MIEYKVKKHRRYYYIFKKDNNTSIEIKLKQHYTSEELAKEEKEKLTKNLNDKIQNKLNEHKVLKQVFDKVIDKFNYHEKKAKDCKGKDDFMFRYHDVNSDTFRRFKAEIVTMCFKDIKDIEDMENLIKLQTYVCGEV